jgi:hypothetical protein
MKRELILGILMISRLPVSSSAALRPFVLTKSTPVLVLRRRTVEYPLQGLQVRVLLKSWQTRDVPAPVN